MNPDHNFVIHNFFGPLMLRYSDGLTVHDVIEFTLNLPSIKSIASRQIVIATDTHSRPVRVSFAITCVFNAPDKLEALDIIFPQFNADETIKRDAFNGEMRRLYNRIQAALNGWTQYSSRTVSIPIANTTTEEQRPLDI